MKHGEAVFSQLCRIRNDRGSLMPARQCCLNSTPVLIYLQRLYNFSVFRLSQFCWNFKLVPMWLVFKIMIIMWLPSPKFDVRVQSILTVFSEIWVLSLLSLSFLKCFPLFCPCVRLSRVYCSTYITFCVYDSFSVNGLDITVFRPL